MRQIALILSLLICAITSAQSTSKEIIYISVLQPELTEIPTEAKTQLETKLNQLLMQNGIASDDPNNRFVLTAKASVVTKDIVAGPPAKVSMRIDFTFIVGDAEENVKYESCTLSTIGVGINENKAFIAAIKNIKPQNRELISFLNAAKSKITAYYSDKCEQIKSDAAREASNRNYEKAIYMLLQIPNVCSCADECQQLAVQYSVEKSNNDAAVLLNQAKSVWASSPNQHGASSAADIIAQIPANTTSQSEIDALLEEINKKLKADEKREWEFRMKQYNDRIEKQKREDRQRIEQQRADNAYRSRQQIANNEYRRTQQAADNAARSQSIEALRQVGIEYAKNQPKSVTYQKNVILW